jgi:hypothetical protein
MKAKLFSKLAVVATILLAGFNAKAQHNSLNPIGTLKGSLSFTKEHPEAISLYKKMLSVPKQRTLLPVIDSIYNWSWDTLGHEWKLDRRTIAIIYDADNNIIGETEQVKKGANWVNSGRFTAESVNNTSTAVAQTWNGASWVNSIRLIHTFNSSKVPFTFLLQKWDGSTWQNVQLTTLTFNSANKQTNALVQNWKDAAWVNVQQNSLVYDASNNIARELVQIWTGTAWRSSEQTLYTYTATNEILSELLQIGDGATWIDFSRSSYSYDLNDDLISKITQLWVGDKWIDASKYDYSYDLKHNLIGKLTYTVNDAGWVLLIQESYTWDANNFSKSQTIRMFNIAEKTVGPVFSGVNSGDSTYNYYHIIHSQINELTASESLLIYPNPSNGKFTIELPDKRKVLQLEIYNMTGERILQQHTSNEVTLPATAKGIYFIKVYDGSEVYFKRIGIQ